MSRRMLIMARASLTSAANLVGKIKIIYIYISISLPVNCYTEGWMHEAAFHRFGKFWKMLDPSDRLCALQLHSDLTS